MNMPACLATVAVSLTLSCTFNVEEWVEDCDRMLERGTGYQGAPDDGTPWRAGSCKGRVARGGSWASGPKELRVDARGDSNQDSAVGSIGIRVARSLQR
jgi:formylglycine-generating enzyme required for sulfatase activity